MSLTCMPVTAEMAERWGLVNHVVDDNEVLSKAIEVAEAIARNNRNLVVLYKSVINDGFKLDLEHAQGLEKVRALCGSLATNVCISLENYVCSVGNVHLISSGTLITDTSILGKKSSRIFVFTSCWLILKARCGLWHSIGIGIGIIYKKRS